MMEMLKMIEEAKDDLEVAEEQVDETIIAAKRLDSGANVWKNFRRNNGRENGVFLFYFMPKIVQSISSKHHFLTKIGQYS
jgi:hypothetical protein